MRHVLIFLALLLISKTITAQQGVLELNQDARILKLLDLKKALAEDDNNSNRYKIQIYSGNRSEAESMQSQYRANFSQWKSTLVHETPNYKVWIGSFRTRLEADRALQKIRETFANSFIFKPKPNKKS